MRLTDQGSFAVTAMIDLALREYTGASGAGRHQRAPKISLSPRAAVRQAAPRAGGEHARRAALFPPGRKAEDHPVADIIVAVDEQLDATGCGGKGRCMGEDSGKA